MRGDLSYLTLEAFSFSTTHSRTRMEAGFASLTTIIRSFSSTLKIHITDDPNVDDVRWVARRLKISQQAAVLRLEQLRIFKQGSHEKWLSLIHNTGNPDWRGKGGGPGGAPPQVHYRCRFDR
jgi:hypothetical protein